MKTVQTLTLAAAALAAALAACNRAPPPLPVTPVLQPLKMDVPANTPPGSPLAPPPTGLAVAALDAGPQAPLMPLREAHPNDPISVDTCTDDWLGRHHLNEYGDPPGTLYPGGTPLFNERTGQRMNRLDYLFAKDAELRADCAPHRASNAPGAAQPVK